MAIFNGQRLTAAAMGLPVERLRRGDYSDKYFDNVVRVLTGLSATGYTFGGQAARGLSADLTGFAVGDAVVEAQLFTRRAPFALVGGVDAALAMLRHASGYLADGVFHETWRDLDVEAVEDGALIPYDGHPENVRPVIRVRGRYRDFALLETAMLGVLTRVSRTATNTYEVAQAASGKPVLFFPARFDLPEVQAADGYGYWLGVERYNHDAGASITPLVSTDAGAAWWGARGGGTVPHALIACFLGDTAEAMVAFARHIPVETPRIVLADFNNDSVGAITATLDAYWPGYRAALLADDAEAMRRWTLNGVRLDTSANLTDLALGPDGEPGVSPALARAVRVAIDNAHLRWNESGDLAEAARAYCARVQIVVSGGFNRARIEQFERDGVPVDIYGVGSTFLRNDRATGTDFTMDIVRVQVDGAWVDVAKVGRRAGDNPDLRPVDLSIF